MRRLAAYVMLTLYACGMRFSWTGRLMFGTGGSMFSRTDTNPNTSTARLAPVALHHVLMCFVQRYLFLVLIAILGGGDAARSHGTEGETRILPPNAGNTGHEGLPGTRRVFFLRVHKRQRFTVLLRGRSTSSLLSDRLRTWEKC